MSICQLPSRPDRGSQFDAVELDADRNRACSLIDLGGRLTNLHCRLVTESVLFADGPIWIADGAPSAAHWIADRLDVCAATAREWIRVGRALSGLDATVDAFERGELTFAKVRAITRIATAENEAELLLIAQTTPAALISKALAAWSIRNEPSDVIEARQHASRSVRWRKEPDGTVTATMRFTPLVAGTLQAAIDTQMMRTRLKREPDSTWPTVANRRADALKALLADGTSCKPDYEVIVHVRGDGNTLDDGTPIPDGPVARLLPDAFVRLLIHNAARHPVNVSSRRRHPTDRQKRFVKERDRVCVDCGRTDIVEYDHIPAYDISGHTQTDELELRCGPCHTARHNKLSQGST